MPSPEWASLDIAWPERSTRITPPRHGDEAHRLAALAADAGKDHPRTRITPELFHHHLDDGGVSKSRGGVSPIRYDATRSGMSITAVGEEAVDCLESNGHKLTRALGAMAGTPLRETWRRGALRLRVGRTLTSYIVPRMLASRRPPSALAVGADLTAGVFTESLGDWLAQRIRHGIERQAALVGIPFPDDPTPILAVTGLDKVTGWRRDGVYYGALVHRIAVASNLLLEGPWSVGHLCLTGNGRVLRIRERLGDDQESPL